MGVGKVVAGSWLVSGCRKSGGCFRSMDPLGAYIVEVALGKGTFLTKIVIICDL